MNKNFTFIKSFIGLAVLLCAVFYFMMPQNFDETEAPLTDFSTQRALEIVKNISKKPHFVGSKNHEVVAQYIKNQLNNLGLEVQFQEGFTFTESGLLVKSKNIISVLKGSNPNNKALVLLSHYDSAPHSNSKGASDDASGVATIIESVRAFIHNNKKHKNDIVILFTDAEELGLNGASLFVTKNKLAKKVGLVLNFEARGSSGPSFMLMETNNGNANMVKQFSNANCSSANSNSLMYSIYKMLPNDTDLTVFREQAKIQGFNFAFIDSHFNYHTSQDSFSSLDPKTLQHQGEYALPLLNYFSNSEISNLNSSEDYVYFTIPFQFVNYPFSWIFPILISSIVLFIVFLFIGFAKRLLYLDQIIKGFGPFFLSIIVSTLLAFLGWKLLLSIYPNYNEILHGFPYNGHAYIIGFVFLSLAVCFFFYKKFDFKTTNSNNAVAPIFIWLVINFFIALYLKGGAFFIFPVLGSILMFGTSLLSQKSKWFLNLLLSIPSLFLIVPFIQLLPVGLGLKMVFVSALLTVLIFGLLLPIFQIFSFKKIWSIIFVVVAFVAFVVAHFNSDFSAGNAKPNSLLYIYNKDTNEAYWTTYDKKLDDWTSNYLTKKPEPATVLNKYELYSKYGTIFTWLNKAPIKKLVSPTIVFENDSIVGNRRFLKIKITPNRNVNRYNVFANTNLKIFNLKVNGLSPINNSTKLGARTSNQILSYYVVDNLPLEMQFSINSNQKLDMSLMESSFDLMTNPLLKTKPRPIGMIAKPFVLNDAVVVVQKIKPSVIIINPEVLNNIQVLKDAVQVVKIDTLIVK